MSNIRGVNPIEERKNYIYLPILDLPCKNNITLNNSVMNDKVIIHHHIFVPHNAKQNWRALLQRIIPTPPIMPETNK
jgi:hypothetical protein